MEFERELRPEAFSMMELWRDVLASFSIWYGIYHVGWLVGWLGEAMLMVMDACIYVYI